jgi:hypothetical protein
MLAEWQTYSRTAPGMQAAPANLSGVRQMLRALRKGETVGLLPDQVPPDGQGVWVPFFGRTAYTMTLAARLAQQTGCAVVLTWCERLPGAGASPSITGRCPSRCRTAARRRRPPSSTRPWNGSSASARTSTSGATTATSNHGASKRRRRSQSMIKRWGSQAIVFLMWLLHWLPLPVLAAIGEGVGALLWRLAGSRRKVVLKNLALCFPELDEAARRRLAASTSVPWPRLPGAQLPLVRLGRAPPAHGAHRGRHPPGRAHRPAGHGCCRTSSGWTTPPRR